MPERSEGHAEIEGGQRPTDPSRRRVERGQGDAGDRRRQPERQVDERVDEAPAWKPVAHQHPGDEETEDGVDRAAMKAMPKLTRKAASVRGFESSAQSFRPADARRLDEEHQQAGSAR